MDISSAEDDNGNEESSIENYSSEENEDGSVEKGNNETDLEDQHQNHQNPVHNRLMGFTKTSARSLHDNLDEDEMKDTRPPINKILHLKTNDDIKFEDSQRALLSHEIIMIAVFSQCCAKKCLEQISPNRQFGNYTETYELIKCCRYELMGMNEEHRMDEMRKIIYGLQQMTTIVSYFLTSFYFYMINCYILCHYVI